MSPVSWNNDASYSLMNAGCWMYNNKWKFLTTLTGYTALARSVNVECKTVVVSISVMFSELWFWTMTTVELIKKYEWKRGIVSLWHQVLTYLWLIYIFENDTDIVCCLFVLSELQVFRDVFLRRPVMSKFCFRYDTEGVHCN